MMRLKATPETHRIYEFCKGRKQGTVPADVTAALGIPSKTASDQLNSMATNSGALRRVPIPNQSRKRYRYFATDSYRSYEGKSNKIAGWVGWKGVSIAQMPIIKIKQGAKA